MMQRDRLAAYRQQHGQQQAHEMTTLVDNNGYTAPPMQADGNGSTDTMTNFYAQVNSVQDSISDFSNKVAQIADLHSRSLNATDEYGNRQNADLLDSVVGQTRELSASLKERIQALASFPVSRPQEQAIRKNQTSLLRQKFLEVLQNYQNVERDYRQKYRQRVERQFKIVKPDATPDEVAAVVNDTEGSGAQIFTQALSSSTRYGESRTAYREVQERHHDIQAIERTLEELAQLFNDMSLLVAQQDEGLDAIQQSAVRVEKDVLAGLDETEKARKHAAAARRKRWACFGIFVFIIAVLALVLGLYFGLKKN